MRASCLSLLFIVPALLMAQATGGSDPSSAPPTPSNPQSAIAVSPWTPLSPAQKAKRRALRLIEPVTLISSAASAGIDQWRRSPRNRDEGGQGYAIRFASAEGFTDAHNTVALIFDEALHLDPRYRRLTEGGVKAHFWNAVSQSFLAYRDSGGRTINISEIGGNFGAGFIAGTWQPAGYRSASASLERGALGLLFHTGKNVVREFLPDILHRGKQ